VAVVITVAVVFLLGRLLDDGGLGGVRHKPPSTTNRPALVVVRMSRVTETTTSPERQLAE
jgi:hypothetical protein